MERPEPDAEGYSPLVANSDAAHLLQASLQKRVEPSVAHLAEPAADREHVRSVGVADDAVGHVATTEVSECLWLCHHESFRVIAL